MKRDSVKPRNRLFVKGYGFLSFTINMGKNVCKDIRKHVSSKQSQKLLDCAKQSATYTLKTASKEALKKTAEATGNLIGSKIADKITKAPKTLPHEEEILRKIFIPSELRQKSINDLRLKEENY